MPLRWQDREQQALVLSLRVAYDGTAADVGARALVPGMVLVELERTFDHTDQIVGMMERWEQLDSLDSLSEKNIYNFVLDIFRYTREEN